MKLHEHDSLGAQLCQPHVGFCMLQFVVNVACTGGIFMNICGHDPLRPLVVPTNSLTVGFSCIVCIFQDIGNSDHMIHSQYWLVHPQSSSGRGTLCVPMNTGAMLAGACFLPFIPYYVTFCSFLCYLVRPRVSVDVPPLGSKSTLSNKSLPTYLISSSYF